MRFYDQLQLPANMQKDLIKNSSSTKEILYNIFVFASKVLLTVGFCITFVLIFSFIFGKNNAVAGVSLLLCLLTFSKVDLGFDTVHSAISLLLYFVILIIGPYMAVVSNPSIGFFINFALLFIIGVTGCHQPLLFNHATLYLSYLLLYGNPVYGKDYVFRAIGIFLVGIYIVFVYYKNHKNKAQKRGFMDLIREFNIHSTRSQWQIKLALGVSLSMFVGQCLGFQRVMWVGIAAMSIMVPFHKDRFNRIAQRIFGTVIGCIVFYILIKYAPSYILSILGIIAGICVSLSATYKWQSVFNTLAALSVAITLFGIHESIFIRLQHNFFAFIFIIIFSFVFDLILHFIKAYTDK